MFRRLSFRRRGDYQCRAFVEAVTDYLEGAMPPRERARFEHHMTLCDGCERYFAQIQVTVRLTGRLTTRDLDAIGPEARLELLTAFREFHAGH
jgi:anti-sigma factor RsiW